MHHPVLQRFLAKSLAANPHTKTVELPLTVARRLIAKMKREQAGKASVTPSAAVKSPAQGKSAEKVKRAAKVAVVVAPAQKDKATSTKTVNAKAVAAVPVTAKNVAAKKAKKSAKVRKAVVKTVAEIKKTSAAGKVMKAVKAAKKGASKVESKAVVVPAAVKQRIKRGMNSQRKLYTIPGYATLSDRSRHELNRHYLENVRDMRVALLNKRGLQQYSGIGPVLEKEIKVWFQGAEVAARG